jgi:sulfotransferase family protein
MSEMQPGPSAAPQLGEAPGELSADGPLGRCRNVVVVGSGRSGTSLVAGLIASAGHHLGRRLIQANEANPRGFFEDFRTVLVNEQILAPYTTELPRPRFTQGPVHQRPLLDMQRWLAVPAPDAEIQASPDLERKMLSTIVRAPWCRKDPRFCHTLPVWESCYGDAIRICVFREPSRTANSMMTLARLQQVELTFDGALEIWAAAYLKILGQHRHRGEWVFVHYDQVLDGSALPRLERAVGARLDASVADAALRRAGAEGSWPPALGEIYGELCDAAGFRATVTAPTVI